MSKNISIKGARVNNLKSIDLEIPKEQLVVVTGVSGSGKTSLVMDTLYAEGQRRYVESLSSYARQFLSRMKKPEVDHIKGLCPAIALEQRKAGGNARSTVGSMTEIYDFLRLLYARIGRTYSPVSNEEVSRDSVSDVVQAIDQLQNGERVYLYATLNKDYSDRSLGTELDLLMKKGYTRLLVGDEVVRIEEFLEAPTLDLGTLLDSLGKEEVLVLIDRFVTDREDEELRKRVADSILTAYQESGGNCLLTVGEERYRYNNRFERDGMTFLDPTPHLFNYNNPYGACPHCEGFGRIMGIDEAKVVPNPMLSVYDEAIAPWKGEKMSWYKDQVLLTAAESDFPIHTPYKDLDEGYRQMLWSGSDYFQGIQSFFEEISSASYKIQNRIMLARYRGRTTCSSCLGKRLRKEASYVKIDGYAITDLINSPLDKLQNILTGLKLSPYQSEIARTILTELQSRLDNLIELGLPYLHLDRLASTLSGGESQRINLTKCIGSTLTSSMYILDEPSIGLHSRDTARLIAVMRKLRDLGNSIIVVEHEEDVIRAADYLIDIGPRAGVFGGEVVYAGLADGVMKADTLTADFLTGRQYIALPTMRRTSDLQIRIIKPYLHNLKEENVVFKINCLNALTGVSGSGKSTLITDILVPSLEQLYQNGHRVYPGCERIEGDLAILSEVIFSDQNAIGKSSRSNAATYVKAYDSIRQLFASQNLSKLRGYKPPFFSFNTDGGRCDTCKGDGEITIEMQFLADVKLVCEDCKGRRFKKEILEIRYREKNIAEVLDMSVLEALDFFKNKRDILAKLRPLDDVGLGYLTLGQPTATLSGGEAQRLKLASYLNSQTKDKLLFIFDEPTTGLHFSDVRKLLDALNALVDAGHTVLVVEHNLDVIKSADWVVDLGPEGGEGGGHVVGMGTPEDIALLDHSHTGAFLKNKIAKS